MPRRMEILLEGSAESLLWFDIVQIAETMRHTSTVSYFVRRCCHVNRYSDDNTVSRYQFAAQTCFWQHVTVSQTLDFLTYALKCDLTNAARIFPSSGKHGTKGGGLVVGGWGLTARVTPGEGIPPNLRGIHASNCHGLGAYEPGFKKSSLVISKDHRKVVMDLSTSKQTSSKSMGSVVNNYLNLLKAS